MHIDAKKILSLTISTLTVCAICWTSVPIIRGSSLVTDFYLISFCIQSITSTVLLYFYLLSFQYSSRFSSPFIPLIVIFSNISLFFLCQTMGMNQIVEKKYAYSIILFCELSDFLLIIGYGLFSQNGSQNAYRRFIALSITGVLCISCFSTATITPDGYILDYTTSTLYYTLSVIAVLVYIVLLLTDPPGSLIARDICFIFITIASSLNLSRTPILKTVASYCLSMCIVFTIIYMRKDRFTI